MDRDTTEIPEAGRTGVPWSPEGSAEPAVVSDGRQIEEYDEGLADRVEGCLSDVAHALARLDDGTYGTCEACGRPMDEGLLELRPEARLCAGHAEAGASGDGGRPG